MLIAVGFYERAEWGEWMCSAEAVCRGAAWPSSPEEFRWSCVKSENVTPHPPTPTCCSLTTITSHVDTKSHTTHSNPDSLTCALRLTLTNTKNMTMFPHKITMHANTHWENHATLGYMHVHTDTENADTKNNCKIIRCIMYAITMI